MPAGHGLLKKAPWVGAFFVCLIWLSSASADNCSPPAATEAVQVRYVHDGDSLVLRDNKKIRLIGINTPEMAHQNQPTQALAVKARDRLRQLLFQQGNRAQLVYGEQQQDRHKRNLAHLWLADGRNLTAELLREGLGWAIAIPPNVRFLDCYLESEKTARMASRGVWDHPDYVAGNSSDLSLRDEGFQLVRGRIVRVNHGGGATWINLEGRFALRIPDQDIGWFKQPAERSWVGREVEVRGWLYSAKGELRVNVQHPAALQFVD
ncbi:MAG: thermonuclease family protein [Pseudomonadota bacterium]|nr:thermonuclease family protein [Pseudomonadota bacterium]